MANIFGIGGGEDIYLTVSPACGLEMTQVDKHGNVKSYAQAPLDYNEAQREIADYEAFQKALETVFAMRNINPAKANIHLSLPTVWFGSKEGLPLLLDDTAIDNIVLGELEQTYIFKRTEPMPFWFDNIVSQNSDSRSIFYTAIQASAVSQIKTILAKMNANLVSVECSLFADLKGLAVTGIATTPMRENQSWSLMIVNNSGFQLIGLQGQRILEYYEEPLPLKSYEGEEIYSAIENAVQIAMMSTPSSTLVVISETDLVSAEILAGRLQFAGTTISVEENQFRKEPLMEMSLNILSDEQLNVSLQSIGAQAPAGIMPVDVNFLAERGKGKPQEEYIEIGNMKITPTKACIIVLILGALILIPFAIANSYTQKIMTDAQTRSQELDGQITDLDNQIKAYQNAQGDTAFNPLDEIERVLKNNRTKIMAYAALGESIPRNIYLTYFLTGDDGKINIRGCADSVEEVYVFFKNLKDSLVESQLRLSKLDLKSGSLDKVVNSTVSTLDDAPYVFEITNMNDDELKSFMNNLLGKKDENNDNNNNNNNEQNQDNQNGENNN